MPAIDIFNTNAFSLVSMTAAINKVPFTPTRIRQLGLFQEEGVTTTTVAVEELNGTLSLVPNQSRRGPIATNTTDKRKVYEFRATHLPVQDVILPDDIQNVRAFGSENQGTAIAEVVRTRLERMKRNVETTIEFHRLGAIRGQVLDSDGTTVIENLFTRFGISQTTVNFVLGTAGTEVVTKCAAVRRAIDAAIGGTPYDRIHAFCGATWFDALVTHPTVKDAYKYQMSQAMRDDNGKAGSTFQFGNITFEEMSRTYAGITPVPTGEAIAFPVGAPDLFITRWAPGNFVEAANTIGLPFYASQVLKPHGKGVEVVVESNPLNICTRPATLIKLTNT
jgi:hypothetical protein